MMLFGEPGIAWIAAGLVLLVAEVVAPGVFMMWLGIAAIGTGLLSVSVPLGFGVEVASFAVLAAVSIAIGLRLRRRKSPSTVNTPAAGLVGRRARSLGFEGREGRVRLGDSDWSARLDPADAVPGAGETLRVLGVEGTVLLVRRDNRA